MHALRELDLRRNSISLIPDGSFNDLKNLRMLLLNNNHIRSINPCTLNGLTSLTLLLLKGNIIHSIAYSSFYYVPNISELDLSENQLTAISASMFYGLNKLENLDVSNNRLSSFDIQLLTHTPRLVHLLLFGNKFSCSCWHQIILASPTLSTVTIDCMLPLDKSYWTLRPTVPDPLGFSWTPWNTLKSCSDVNTETNINVRMSPCVTCSATNSPMCTKTTNTLPYAECVLFMFERPSSSGSSTSVEGAGRCYIDFDCSNRIRNVKVNNITTVLPAIPDCSIDGEWSGTLLFVAVTIAGLVLVGAAIIRRMLCI